jgi:hypothetical protein
VHFYFFHNLKISALCEPNYFPGHGKCGYQGGSACVSESFFTVTVGEIMHSFKKVLFVMLVLIAVPSFALQSNISVLPSTAVEVGDEVFFSGAATTNGALTISDPSLQQGWFEWDFGDGFAMKRGFPDASCEHSGVSCIHIFMKPGTFNVKLRVTDAGNNKDSTTVSVTVTGVTPLKGFELWHAPFHARLAQYIYTQVPQTVYGNAANGLRITVHKDSTLVSTLVDKTGLSKEEKFLLKNADLPAGNYFLLAELLDASKNRLSYIKEKFAKPYAGAPLFGIDENNSFVSGGKKYFPVTPWQMSTNEFASAAGKYVNCAFGEGYTATHNCVSWTGYLTSSSTNNILAIGPQRWEGLGETNCEKNSDPRKIVEYVTGTSAKPAMAMWMWKDEPNMGGRDLEVPAEVLSSWTYLSHVNDPQHPVVDNLYGFDYLSYYTPTGSYVDYLRTDSTFGGKKHFSFDALGHDIYPIHFGDYSALKGRRVISEWAASIDKLSSNNYNLMPYMMFIEVQDIGGRPTPPPTANQIIMESWIGITHGSKAINWFPYFGSTPQAAITAMSNLYTQITNFSQVILAGPSARSFANTATTPSNRVDCLLRTVGAGADTSSYLFAVRVTEPDPTAVFVDWKEPDTVKATFSIGGIGNADVVVEGENRTLKAANGSFTDAFGKCAVHIYRIGKDLLPALNGNSTVRLPRKVGDASAGSGLLRLTCKPFGNVFSFASSREVTQVRLYNLLGKIVNISPVKNNQVVWNKVPLNGIYLIDFSNNKAAAEKVTLFK